MIAAVPLGKAPEHTFRLGDCIMLTLMILMTVRPASDRSFDLIYQLDGWLELLCAKA